MRHRLLATVSLAFVVTVGGARATTLDPAVLLGSFNLITSGNATTNGDIEGAMFVGGNFTGAAGTANLFNNFARLPAETLSYVYGANSSQMNINNGGSLYIAGSNSGNINLNGGGNKLQIGGANSGNINGSGGGIIAIGGSNSGAVNANGNAYLIPNSTTIIPAMSVPDVIGALSIYSATLASLPANGTITAVPNNSLTFSYGGTGQAVFNIMGSMLASDLVNANMAFAIADPSSPVVVNVDLGGASLSLPSSGHFASGTPLPNVLFNFYNGAGTTLDFGSMWEASVLAMGSKVINHTPIEGSVAAASFEGHGELHNFPLHFPPGEENPPPSDVPEPASLALLLAGLMGFAGRLNRSRKAAA